MDNHVLGKIADGMGKDLAYLPPAKIAKAYEDEWLARYGELLFSVSMQCDAKTIQLVKDLAKFVTPAIAGYTAGVANGFLPGRSVDADAIAETVANLFDNSDTGDEDVDWSAVSDATAQEVLGEEPECFDEMTGPMDESGFGAGAGVGHG